MSAERIGEKQMRIEKSLYDKIRLDMGVNYNKSRKENPEVEYIKDALRYFIIYESRSA